MSLFINKLYVFNVQCIYNQQVIKLDTKTKVSLVVQCRKGPVMAPALFSLNVRPLTLEPSHVISKNSKLLQSIVLIHDPLKAMTMSVYINAYILSSKASLLLNPSCLLFLFAWFQTFISCIYASCFREGSRIESENEDKQQQ